MKISVRWLADTFFSKKLDFRVRLYNVLAMAGILVGMLMTLTGIIANAGIGNVVSNIAGALLALGLLVYSYRTGRYRQCYVVTIVAVFLILFPVLFFTAGGYHSGMPAYFIFAVCFTVFMLEGWLAVVISALETAVYFSICLYAYFRPEYVNFYATETEVLTDIVISFIVVITALGTTMFLHFRLYNEQQRELEKAKQMLAEENAVLEKINRLKTEFLGNVSHELKTPLAVMMSISQNAGRELSNREHSEELIKDMRLLASENQRLSLMVTQILDVTRIEENSMVWNPMECNISEIIQTTKATYYPLLKKNGNRLVIEPCEDLPPAHADPDRISQVIVNLLQNAIRHTINGQITISTSEQNGFIEISVSDTGSGIEKERMPYIFERFKSHDSNKKAGTSRDTGSGLGLFICKHIVNNMGGSISIDSELGKGTTVRFSLPVHQSVDLKRNHASL